MESIILRRNYPTPVTTAAMSDAQAVAADWAEGKRFAVLNVATA